MVNSETWDRACHLTCEMIAIDTINPMGRPYDCDRPVERPLVEFLEERFADADVVLRRDRVSDMHENLEIRIAGQTDGPPLFFESHMDTVPADDWPRQALAPRVEDGFVFGRGACDDKGSLAAMTLAVLELVETGQVPPRPVVFLAAGDEECAQTGIRHYMQASDQRFSLGVFGEPTSNVPVIQHKGTIRWDMTTHGKSAHTSQPELGRNAIHDMVQVIQSIQNYEERMQSVHTNPLLSGPRINTTMIQGGRTRNAVPDECTIAVDYRILPGLKGVVEREKLIAELETLGVAITHAPPQTDAPSLSTPPDDPQLQAFLEISREVLGGQVAPVGAPYGTDAAWMSPAATTVVLGPGNIRYAHAIDERIPVAEIVQAAEIYRRLMPYDWNAT